MTDEELRCAKEAKRKGGANVVEQEFAQPKHCKDPQETTKRQSSLCKQPARNKLQEAILYHYSRLARGKPSSWRKGSANRNKGEETPPTSTSVENKTPSYNNSLDNLDYVRVSPEFSEDLISDLGTGYVNNYINSFIASNTESSTASVVVSTAPTYTTLQLATTAHMHFRMSILNTLPGVLTLEKTVSSLVVCLVSPLSPLSPACLNLLDVNFKRMSSILWHWFYPINSLL